MRRKIAFTAVHAIADESVAKKPDSQVDPVRKTLKQFVQVVNTERPKLLMQSLPWIGVIAGVAVGVFAGMQLASNAQPQTTDETATAEDFPSLPTNSTQAFRAEPVETFESTEDADTQTALQVDDKTTEPAAPSLETTSPTARLLAASDEWLRTGYFSRALTGFETVLNQSDATSKESVQFRVALCREFLGEISDAQQAYRALAQTESFPTLRSLAQLGEARCLAARGETELLRTQYLPFALLDETMYANKVTGELLHLTARAMMLAERKTSPQFSETKAENGDSLAIPSLIPDPGEILQQLSSKELNRPTNFPAFEILQNTEQSPETCFVRVNQPTVSVLSLLTDMLQECGFASDLSSKVLTSIKGHGQSVIVADKSLSLILDGICLRFGLIWQANGTTIVVRTLAGSTASEVTKFNSSMTERLLRWATLSATDSYQAHTSQLLLGVVHYDRAEYIDAAQVFQVYLERHPHTVLTGLAAFNLARCYVKTNELSEAEKSMLLSIDHSHSTFETRIAAYMYLGRLRLETGQLQAAVSTLIRGASQSRGYEAEADIGLLLASAYLLADNPHASNSILMERRSLFRKPDQRKAVAFLSAYCRLRRAADPERIARETQGVVSALANFRPGKMQSKHWYQLTAAAYEDVGLRSNAIGTYIAAMKDDLPEFLKDHCCVELAKLYSEEGEISKAESLFEMAPGKEGSKLYAPTMMSRARLAIQSNDLDSAIQFASKVAKVASDESTVRQALVLLGEAYEQRGDHQAAVYCYAGMVPDYDPLPEIQQTKHSEVSTQETPQ